MGMKGEELESLGFFGSLAFIRAIGV